MNRPMIIAPNKLKPLRIRVTFIPKYLASTGIVNIPTIFNVVINMAMIPKLTPLSTNIPARGYDINPGIRDILPTIPATI